MPKDKSGGEKLVQMVESPALWYGKNQFDESGVSEEIYESMKEDSQHLMKIDLSDKKSFLGGYILGYSVRKGMRTRDIIRGMPFQYRHVCPFKFAQIMEIHPEDIPETYKNSRGKKMKTVERAQFNGGLVYGIPVGAFAYLSLPVVNQKDICKLSSIDLAYKYRVTGNEEYLEEFLDRVRGDVGRIVNRSFGLQKKIYGYELLVAMGLEGAKMAFCRHDFSRDINVETYMQKRVRGNILDFLREDDEVPRLIRKAQTKIEEIVGERDVDLEDIYEMIPDISKDAIDRAYRLVTGIGRQISLDAKVGNDDSKVRSIHDLTEDEHPSVMMDPADRMGNKELLEIILKKLRPFEREMVVGYFLEAKTIKEIGEENDISESRMSQIFPGIVKRMKAEAGKYEF